MKPRRSLLRYPLFQIPLICLGFCLLATLLCALLGLGRPQVAVAIALDLSGSTYDNDSTQFNAPGTVMAQEVAAVEAYLKQSSTLLRRPNQVQVFGFAGEVQPLTTAFDTDAQKISQELNQTLRRPNLDSQMGSGTDLNLAIKAGLDALAQIEESCREVLLVTDGEADVRPDVVAQAVGKRIPINSVVIGSEAPALRLAAVGTGGTYLSGEVNNLKVFFTDKFFTHFNSNMKWIIFGLGLSWIALMWLLVLPLDHWLFQDLLKLPMNLAGQFALSHALFWTVATPFIVWRLAGGIPLFSQC